MRPVERLSNLARRILGNELHLFLAYSVIVLRPGAEPPKHPHPSPEHVKAAPATWTDEEYQLYIEEARNNMANQRADKSDIRARAQIILTTAIVVGGVLVTSFNAKTNLCLGGKLLYGAAALFTVMAGLAAGGIISAKSPIGAPNILALPYQPSGSLYRRVADEYACSRSVGAETIAVLVTVLRDCVLALIFGAVLLAVAHIRT